VQAIVMAAGAGTRMRPISERWPKPILPIDGRPVIATLLRDLACAGCDDVTVVTGHLAEQIEQLLGDGSAFGVRIRYVRQPRPDGSADAVRCALAGGAQAPALVTGADHVFARATFASFLTEWGRAPGAVAARRGEPRLDARVARFFPDPDGLTGVPLWGLRAALVPLLDDLPGPPFELADAFARAPHVRGVVVAGTRDLTHPVDLIRENFPYLDERPRDIRPLPAREDPPQERPRCAGDGGTREGEAP
jgi:GTP:adenosylcobinamide-phosphate guanylyltransferase